LFFYAAVDISSSDNSDGRLPLFLVYSLASKPSFSYLFSQTQAHALFL
jgi:hypothetical protein